MHPVEEVATLRHQIRALQDREAFLHGQLRIMDRGTATPCALGTDAGRVRQEALTGPLATSR